MPSLTYYNLNRMNIILSDGDVAKEVDRELASIVLHHLMHTGIDPGIPH
jgi:hypothetical protein